MDVDVDGQKHLIALEEGYREIERELVGSAASLA